MGKKTRQFHAVWFEKKRRRDVSSTQTLMRIVCVAVAFSSGILICDFSHGAETSAQKFEPNPVVAQPTPAPKSAKTKIEFSGVTHFREGELREALSEQIQAIDQSGLNSASADDTAFFLGVFYRKNGYSQVDVKWKIAASDHLSLSVAEGPLAVMGVI